MALMTSGIPTETISQPVTVIPTQTIIDLSTSLEQASILGANTADHLSGNEVLGSFSNPRRARALAAGDFNNDGVQDLVVGAPDADVTFGSSRRVDAGICYIVFGGGGFATTTIIDTNPTALNQPNIRILGAMAGDNLGFALAAGDINGDTIDDLAIGAPGVDFPGAGTANPPRADAGAVFLLFGSSNVTDQTLDLAAANAAQVIIYGARTGDHLGSALAVGNVGGLKSVPLREQAIKDLLIGAPDNTGPSPMTAPRNGGGAAYVIFGGRSLNSPGGLTQVIDLGITLANVIIYGKTGSTLGSSVAIGDVNRDQIGDVLIGAPLAERPSRTAPLVPAAAATGGAFAFFGGSTLTSGLAASKTFDLNTTSASVSVYGASAYDQLGASVAANDVNGDGLTDWIIGAPEADGPNEERPEAGEAYVILGGPILNSRKRIDAAIPANMSLLLFGARPGDHFGSTVAAGSLNLGAPSDSIPDLVIGAPAADFNKGAVSILFGGFDLLTPSMRDISLGQDDVRVIGRAPGDELGWALLIADLDRSGSGNLIIGAPLASVEVNQVTRVNTGRVYVLLP